MTTQAIIFVEVGGLTGFVAGIEMVRDNLVYMATVMAIYLTFRIIFMRVTLRKAANAALTQKMRQQVYREELHRRS